MICPSASMIFCHRTGSCFVIQCDMNTRRCDGSINVTTFAFEDGKLKAIYMVRNPHKLAGVRW